MNMCVYIIYIHAHIHMYIHTQDLPLQQSFIPNSVHLALGIHGALHNSMEPG